MAKRVIQLLVDDLDGGDAEETVKFAVNGTEFEIDLSTANAEAFRAVLAPYTSNGQKVGGSNGRRKLVSAPKPANLNSGENTRIREWFNGLAEAERSAIYAKGGGRELASMGRVPGDVVAAYNSPLARSASIKAVPAEVVEKPAAVKPAAVKPVVEVPRFEAPTAKRTRRVAANQ